MLKFQYQAITEILPCDSFVWKREERKNSKSKHYTILEDNGRQKPINLQFPRKIKFRWKKKQRIENFLHTHTHAHGMIVI